MLQNVVLLLYFDFMPRITFTPVIYSQYQRQDGTYSVKMRITLNRKSRYITTSEIATRSQLTKSLAIKDPALLSRLRELELRMRNAVSDLDVFTLSKMTIADVVEHMEHRINGNFRLDFFKFWEEAIQSKARGSRENYLIALHAFQRFIGRPALDISQVTSRLMREYESYLTEKHGKGARCVTAYTAAVAHIHSLARKKYNNDETMEQLIKNPFEYYKPPKQNAPAHRNVSPAIIQAMIERRRETSGMERKAVDAFLLSFALMGMNATDMLSCKHPIDGVIIYNRKKTCDRRADKAEMHVQIDSRIYPLFHEWAGKDDEHAFIYHTIHTSNEQFNASLAHGLQKYRNRMGIPPKGLDFYSARHTWASIAYSIGIDKSIINDCLCHVDEAMKVTDIYINKDWSVLWEANRRVLDQFDWSPLKED